MKAICFLLFLIFFCLSAMEGGNFYRHDNGWVYTGSEMSRIIDTLSAVKEKISTKSTRTQVENAFREVFEQRYANPEEQVYKETAFAWTQACLKRTKNPVAGIEREIGWIRKNYEKKAGIYLNHRPSNWHGLNWLWNFSKEEKQKDKVDGKVENKTWEVDTFN